jgi:hypothetical protein
MDPYLEDSAFWHDFHGQFIYACREALLAELPPTYDAVVDERVRLVEIPPDELLTGRVKDIVPDLAVTRDSRQMQGPAAGGAPAPGGSGAAVLEPVRIPVAGERELKERWIEIVHRPDDALVTVIELLSPTNKSGDGLGEYRGKRRALLRQHVNVVELDLLVGGRRVEHPEVLPAGDYYVLVSRANEREARYAYAWSVRRPLPAIHVPLKAGESDVVLDLASAFTFAYDHGYYHRRLRYQSPPRAALSAADREWAQAVVRAGTQG